MTSSVLPPGHGRVLHNLKVKYNFRLLYFVSLLFLLHILDLISFFRMVLYVGGMLNTVLSFKPVFW